MPLNWLHKDGSTDVACSICRFAEKKPVSPYHFPAPQNGSPSPFMITAAMPDDIFGDANWLQFSFSERRHHDTEL